MSETQTAPIAWENIEKGNTQKGVNKAIIQFLAQKKWQSLFDIPCGQGEFLRSLQRIFPKTQLLGQDLYAEPVPEIRNFFLKGDAKSPFSQIQNKTFDIITSISGVMVFDHVSGFFENCRQHLNPQGYLIVTNDNILTIRDRLSFLFLGRLKRFKLHYSKDEGNWNVMLIQGLWKQFKSHGFEIEKIEYTTHYVEDIIFFPVALFLYPLWALYIFLGKGEMTFKERKELFPFFALTARHYVIYGKRSK